MRRLRFTPLLLHRRPALLPFFSLIFLVQPLAGAASSPFADTPAFSLSGKDLQAAATTATGAATAPAVVLLDDEHWTFRADKKVERRRHYVFKILDSSAVQNWGGVQERWEPWHEQRPVIRARVVTPDGLIHDLDPKSLVDGPVGSAGPMEYSDVRVLQGPLPAVEVGSVIEWETTQVFEPALGSLSFRGYVAGAVPVRFARMVLDYPADLPFRYEADLCPDLKETKVVTNGNVHLTVVFGAFDAIKQVDQLLPFDVPRAPSVTMSTGASWHDLARMYNGIVDEQIAGAPVAALVKQAVGSETDRQAVIDKVVRALHDQVRYTGVEFGDAAVIPAKPADTLGRKYGDCKDKSSLLVAMLRQAGIPAYVALLDAGLDQDVSPKFPGMGMFNHAIVYVPGKPDLWIDATAAHTAVGIVPAPDEGRLALVVRPETTDLVKVPVSGAASNVSNTVREFKLPQFGPAHVTETISGAGFYDSTFREVFAMVDNEQFRDQMQKQSQAEWGSKSPVQITHPGVDDFSQPFHVTMSVSDAKNVLVTEGGATIPLTPGAVFSAMPQYFLREEDKDEKKDSNKPRTAGFELPSAFTQRLTYHIDVPDGFVVKQVPADQTVALGPATYTAKYELKGQVLTAELSLDSGKREYTLEEGNALRKAALEFIKQPVPVLVVQPKGEGLLEQGKLREGLDSYRTLAQQHSQDAIDHVRLARAYLTGTCGQQAREEAQQATKIAPDLAVTWRTLAFVNEFDLVGRKYKPGWNPVVVESALRKAMSIDKDDDAIPVELAQSFEYTPAGIRYGSMERLKQAVQMFESISDDKLEQQGAQNFLLWDLLYVGDVDSASRKVQQFGTEGNRLGFSIYLKAIKDGGAKAAKDLTSGYSEDQAKQAEQTVESLLTGTGKYTEAADFAAALSGDPQAQTTAAMLRNTHRIDPKTLNLNKPEDLLSAFVCDMYDPDKTPEEIRQLWTKSIPDSTLDRVLESWQRMMMLGAQNNSLWAARDMHLSMAKRTTEQNGDSGYRVRESAGNMRDWIAIVREDGKLKILGNGMEPEGIGHLAISLARAGKTDEARKYLDWVREDSKIQSEDDALGGPIFPRLWNRGAAVSAHQIEYAAASLISGKEALPILKAAIAGTADATTKNYYRLAFLYACVHQKAWADCEGPAQALATAYPNSDTALDLYSHVLSGEKRFEQAEKVLRTGIAHNADDLQLKRSLIERLAEAHKIKEAEETAKQTAEAPDSAFSDWNLYGWISIFAGDVTEDKIHQVERAQSQPNEAVQQTIASMYAEIGKLNEARHICWQSLDQFGYETPNATWWYVFGRIAEQLNDDAAAQAYYAKVDDDDTGVLSNYALTQHRLAVMKTDKTGDGRAAGLF